VHNKILKKKKYSKRNKIKELINNYIKLLKLFQKILKEILRFLNLSNKSTNST
jgi:hypothetical protein